MYTILKFDLEDTQAASDLLNFVVDNNDLEIVSTAAVNDLVEPGGNMTLIVVCRTTEQQISPVGDDADPEAYAAWRNEHV
jgi:hypothetical protein